MSNDRPISAMISYQSADSEAAELLHEELSLRGFVVVHDQCTFASGSRIPTEMELGVETCDAFISYLTPESLYLGKALGSPRPALDGEFLPTMQRRRRTASSGTGDRVVVLPVPKRLGSRAEAAETVFRQTGEDIGSLWIKSVRTGDPTLSRSEASEIAQEALVATLAPGPRSVGDPVPLTLATRGEGQPPQFLTLDATWLVGGTRRAGTAEDWGRILRALRHVEQALGKTPARSLELVVKAHICGAVALGRIFHQGGGWRLSVAGRYGPVRPSPMRAPGDWLTVATDPHGRGPDLSCEISLVGQPVFEMAREAIRSLSLALSERLQLTAREPGEIDSEAASCIAAEAAWVLRERIKAKRPPRTHIFCAAPVEIAVLLGHRLTALSTDLHLYEPEGNSYRLALVLPASIP